MNFRDEKEEGRGEQFMKKTILTIFAGSLLLGATGMAFADDPPPPGTIKQRKENQQDRIANGVKNGSLTAGETKNLEGKESRLNKEIHHDRVQNGGNLTNKEKVQINKQQNHLSKQIYNKKHNAANQ
jgi:hypothetical protein